MKCSFSYEVILFDGNNYFSETGVSFATQKLPVSQKDSIKKI